MGELNDMIIYFTVANTKKCQDKKISDKLIRQNQCFIKCFYRQKKKNL